MTAAAAGHILAGRYRIERHLGAGAMGVVVAATEISSGLRVAIKLLAAESFEVAARKRFLREAKIACHLRNEHTVRTLEVGEAEDGLPFLVMELLEGETLGRLLERDGAVAPERAISYALDVCEALAEAHEAGIVHRDIKPDNVFVASRPGAPRITKVLDFGLSVVKGGGIASTRMTTSTSVFGSPAYMSPEQLVSTHRVDARADIYSLGVLLYELLSKELPFVGPTLAEMTASIMRDPPRPLATLRAGLPPALVAVVHRCIQKNPRDRYQTVQELTDALVAALVDPRDAPKTIAMSHAPSPREALEVQRPRRRRARPRSVAVATVVACAVIVLGGICIAIVLR